MKWVWSREEFMKWRREKCLYVHAHIMCVCECAAGTGCMYLPLWRDHCTKGISSHLYKIKRIKQWLISVDVVSGKLDQKLQGWKGSSDTSTVQNHQQRSASQPANLIQDQLQLSPPWDSLLDLNVIKKKKEMHTSSSTPDLTGRETRPLVWTGNRSPSAKWPSSTPW